MPSMHQHHTNELFYTVGGAREYFIEDSFFKLCATDTVLVPRDVLHRTDGAEAVRILVYFSDDYLKEYFTPRAIEALRLDKPTVFRPGGCSAEYIGQLFSELYNEYTAISKKGDPSKSPIVAGYIYQILFLISNGINAYLPSACSDERVGRIAKYINENYSSIGDIDEIAEKFYLSKYHLCRIFKQNLGVGIIS